jgi:hypothetical protein
MRYMLINHVQEAGWDQLTAEQQTAGIAAYAAFTDALTAAGALKGSGRLRPSATAKTVRLVGGKPKVMDGPFAESKEVFGGYFVIEAPDEAAALAWAARCPAAGHGAVEVRALWDGM